ncbi:hypothetical protein Ddye_016579 [Dipteronia dyeriana]|uniref:ATP-dependent DNA helicase n=1 Tax=Dipteronia dyeriana TaxID=168575 RepID=A0AAD9U7T6_9ROSI|nr:hypothetical protein Ddye_016579 [Dipteronia dyeriana]
MLQKNNKSLNDFPPLPTPNRLLLKEMGNRLMREKLAYDTDKLLLEHQELHTELNNDQKRVYNVVVNSVAEDRRGLFFVFGARGPGKTYLYKTIIARLRGEGKIVLTVASSGIATCYYRAEGLHIPDFKFQLTYQTNPPVTFAKELS